MAEKRDRTYDIPKTGVYEGKDGFLHDILTHEIVLKPYPKTKLPINGTYYRYNGDRVDLADILGQGGSGVGAIVIKDKHFFQDETERDQYFADNPGDLKDHMYIACGDHFQIYIASENTWEDITSIVQGPKGDAGEKGDTGAQGPQGPQGLPGEDGSDSMPEPPNDRKRYSRVWDGTQYVWEHDPEVQEPFIEEFKGDPYITLPSPPNIIMDVWIMQTTANPLMLLKSDYTVSGNTITPINPVFGSGMTIKVVYTA